jgi:hypothetical protein
MKTDASRKKLIPGGLFLLAALLPCLAAAPLSQAESDPSPITVDLEYQELPHSFLNWEIIGKIRAEPFSREPELSSGTRITRGILQFRFPDQELPFLWDANNGKLHLDLNKNLDLTDDHDGVFSASTHSRHSQHFADVRVDFTTDQGVHRFFFDLHLRNYGNRPRVSAALRSIWQGKLVVEESEWQVGLAQNLSDHLGNPGRGYLLLRPWDARDKPFAFEAGSLDGFDLTRHLFFQGRGFQLDFDYLSEPPASKYRMALLPLRPNLGELEITGQSIKRVVLVSPPYTVVLDAPGPKIEVPTGRYEHCQILLEADNIEAHPELYGHSRRFEPIIVDREMAAVLKEGGPLTNSASLTRRGKHLTLSYQLLGADGRPYQLRNQDRSKPPRFAVFHKGKQIHAGQFEYG